MRLAMIRRLTLTAATALAMLAFASPAWAATFTVTKTADTNDGACNSDCSLREAVGAANANAGAADTVNFAPGVGGTIPLNAASGGISIYDVGLTINGPGAGALAVSANDATRPFGVASGAVATINGLTIKDGKTHADDTSGGGILNLGTLTLNDSSVSGNEASNFGDASNSGGGIKNNGTLTLNDSTVSGNKAIAGGGISNGGTLTLNDSTVSGNEAGLGGGGISNSGNFTLDGSTVSDNTTSFGGGGILSSTGSEKTVTISNSTISGNAADEFGGGIYNGNGLTRIENSTITDNNTAAGEGSGVASSGDAATRTEVFSTIISANANNDDVGSGSINSFDSDGYNLIGGGDATGAFDQPGDRTGATNPGLGPLLRNIGSTQTHALLGTSPALDKGTNAGCPATDQRGVARPQRGTCDIGSFERLNAAPVAGNDSYNGVDDKTLNIPARGVLRNDTDADGDTLTARRVSGPTKGRLALRPNGSFAYKPPKNFNGVVRFVYRASDGKGGADNATVTIKVRATG